MSMFRISALSSLLLCVTLSAFPAEAQHRREQDAARDAYRAGQVKSLREIEERVVPRMQGAEYLGPEFDPSTATYRLKFMRGSSVFWVDVDARSGAIIGRAGG